MDYKIDILPARQDNYIFLITCLKSKKTACIDPCDGAPVLSYLKEHNLNLVAILNTHHHYDHVGGNQYLKEQTNCDIYGFSEDKNRIPGITKTVQDGEHVEIGKIDFLIKHVPGHTTGHIFYYAEKEQILFCGDTLFSSGCGRLFEGTYEQMYNSLAIIKNLADSTKIYCAHEYTLSNIEFALTLEPNNQDLLNKQLECQKLRKENKPTIPTDLATEKATNPFLRTLEPDLRKSMDMCFLAYNVDVFKKIRQLKDKF